MTRPFKPPASMEAARHAIDAAERADEQPFLQWIPATLDHWAYLEAKRLGFTGNTDPALNASTVAALIQDRGLAVVNRPDTLAEWVALHVVPNEITAELYAAVGYTAAKAHTLCVVAIMEHLATADRDAKALWAGLGRSTYYRMIPDAYRAVASAIRHLRAPPSSYREMPRSASSPPIHRPLYPRAAIDMLVGAPMRATVHEVDRACQEWAKQRRLALGLMDPKFLEPYERVGRLQSALSAPGMELMSGPRDARSVRHPEVFQSIAGEVQRVRGSLTPIQQGVLHQHYVLAETDLRTKARNLELPLALYLSELRLLRKTLDDKINWDA